MHPAAVVEHHPKGVLLQLAQVRHDCDEYVLDTFIVKRKGKMVVIDDIMALLRSKNYGDHVVAQEFGTFCGALLAPALSLSLDLTQADGDLCPTKFRNRHWLEKRLTCVWHRYLSSRFCETLRQLQHRDKQSTPLAHPSDA